MEIFNAKEIYENYSYPEEFIKIVDLNLVDLDLWYLMNKEQVEIRIKGLKDRFPQRKLIPFARRDDGDDIACFEVGKENRVQCRQEELRDIHNRHRPGHSYMCHNG